MARPFIPVANTVSVEMLYTYHTVTCENVFHVAKGAPYTATEISNLRNGIIAWYDASWRGLISSDAQFNRIRIKALDTEASPMEDYAISPSHNGTLVTPGCPNNVTWCIKLQTGLAGRSQRGRWYVIGIAQSALVSGIDLNTTTASSMVNALNTLIANLIAGAQNLVITSFRTNGAWRATGHNTNVTTAVAVDYHLDSQRRRQVGRGQ